ncbi:MAG: hypothetical protein ABI056_01710 [Caulobacteraceae bacterium]
MSSPAETTEAGANGPASWSERVQAAAEEISRFMRVDFTHNPFAAFDRKVFIASASRTGKWRFIFLRRRSLARRVGELARVVGASRSEPVAAAPTRLALQSTALNSAWEAWFRAEHIELVEGMETVA